MRPQDLTAEEKARYGLHPLTPMELYMLGLRLKEPGVLTKRDSRSGHFVPVARTFPGDEEEVLHLSSRPLTPALCKLQSE